MVVGGFYDVSWKDWGGKESQSGSLPSVLAGLNVVVDGIREGCGGGVASG